MMSTLGKKKEQDGDQECQGCGWGQAAILNGVIRIDLLTEKAIFEPSQIWKEAWEVPILGVRVF